MRYILCTGVVLRAGRWRDDGHAYGYLRIPSEYYVPPSCRWRGGGVPVMGQVSPWCVEVPYTGFYKGERESPEDLKNLPGEIIGHTTGYIMDNIWVYSTLFECAPCRYSTGGSLVHLQRKAIYWAQLSLSIEGTGLWPHASGVLYIDPQSAGFIMSSIL